MSRRGRYRRQTTLPIAKEEGRGHTHYPFLPWHEEAKGDCVTRQPPREKPPQDAQAQNTPSTEAQKEWQP